MTSIFFDTVQHREQINQLTSYIDASMVSLYKIVLVPTSSSRTIDNSNPKGKLF